MHWIGGRWPGRGLATVAECYRLTNSVFKAACRDRLLGFNPCDGVKLPRRRKKDTDDQVISRAEFHERLLPAVPDRYRGTLSGDGAEALLPAARGLEAGIPAGMAKLASALDALGGGRPSET